MPVFKSFPENHPSVIRLKEYIIDFLSVKEESVKVSFGYENDPKLLYITLKDFDIGCNFFDLQKINNLQNVLNIKISKFRIYDDRRVLMWCEFTYLH